MTWTAMISAPVREAMRAARRRRISSEGCADHPDDQSFAGLPGCCDLVIVLIALKRVFDAIGEPQERELSQVR